MSINKEGVKLFRFELCLIIISYSVFASAKVNLRDAFSVWRSWSFSSATWRLDSWIFFISFDRIETFSSDLQNYKLQNNDIVKNQIQLITYYMKNSQQSSKLLHVQFHFFFTYITYIMLNFKYFPCKRISCKLQKSRR